jgi:hypothetical protein
MELGDEILTTLSLHYLGEFLAESAQPDLAGNFMSGKYVLILDFTSI